MSYFLRGGGSENIKIKKNSQNEEMIFFKNLNLPLLSSSMPKSSGFFLGPCTSTKFCVNLFCGVCKKQTNKHTNTQASVGGDIEVY